MKIGFVSQIGDFPEKGWEGEFQTAQQKNLSHLEVVVSYPHFGPSTYSPEQLEKIKRYSEIYRIPLILHLLPYSYDFPEMGELRNKEFDLSSSDEDIRQFSIDEVRKTLRIARELNARLVVVHAGKYTNIGDYEERLGIARKTLEQIHPELQDVKLAIENMPITNNSGTPNTEIPSSAQDLITLVQGLENIGICYDIGHANTLGDPIEYYDKLKQSGKIWDMHIHDNTGKGDEHLPIGQGNIDFLGFVRQLQKDGYQGHFSIELDIPWTEHPMPIPVIQRTTALEYFQDLMVS
jgi:sugar phosphate isomerase/epimerase